jgi:aminodeoxyfutalosine deaminase
VRLIKGDRIFDGRSFLPESSVLVIDEANNFKEIVSENALDKNSIQYFNGIICPGFVNAHCHLELSHLQGKIATATGLPQFAKEIIIKRNQSSEQEIEESMVVADNYMYEHGIVAVGDISNSATSIHAKKQSSMYYHTFVELIGLAPERSEQVVKSGLEIINQFKQHELATSLAPHAPYSTSYKLIKAIAQYDSEIMGPFSIHNQESEEETKFFLGEKNEFQNLYDFLKLDITWFKATGQSSLKSYGDLLKKNTALLVHNTFTSKEDMESVEDKNCYWCFCPGANLYIENCLPDYAIFKPHAKTICLGTDSLASNQQLNLLAEANHILKASSVFRLDELLAMLTFNGAKALGIDNRYGQFIQGKNSGVNLIEFTNSELRFIQKIC